MSREDSRVWFDNVVPEMARLLLQLPSLLESHYLKSDELFSEGKSGIRIMGPQEPGRVFLSQVRLDEINITIRIYLFSFFFVE